MSEKKPIIGLDLGIDPEYLESVVRSTVSAGIAEALGGKEAVPLIDWYAQKVIREAAKESVAEMVEARRGEIRKAIKRALVDDSTINAMASEYVSALVRECGRGYTPKFEVSFEKERGY